MFVLPDFSPQIDNPYGATCYGLSQASMVSWIRDFSNTYNSKTGRYPTIYTTTDWWTTCTGNNASFGATNPLWIARYASAVGTIPAGFPYHSIWQYTSTGATVGDHNVSYFEHRIIFNPNASLTFFAEMERRLRWSPKICSWIVNIACSATSATLPIKMLYLRVWNEWIL